VLNGAGLVEVRAADIRVARRQRSRALADLDRGRVLNPKLAGDGLAVGRDDVCLPVIERELRRLPEFPLSSRDVRKAW
jgi:hypothetical protein